MKFLTECLTAGDYRKCNHWLLFFLYCLLSQTIMSHFEQVKTEYTDPELVVEAIRKAFPFVTEIDVASDFEHDGSTVICRGYHGATATHGPDGNPMKIIARTGNQYDLGFTLAKDGTFQLVADWGGYGYGFLANPEVKAEISSDRTETERLLGEQEDYSPEQITNAMTNYPSRQQAVMGMLARGYTMAVAEECVRVDPNLAGYHVNEIKVLIGKNTAGQLQAEHTIELVQSTIVGSYI